MFIIDEWSMFGRSMCGKVDFRVQEALPNSEYSFGGRDVVLSGGSNQARPIGDDPLYYCGPYQGKALNKPTNGEIPPGTPSMEMLHARGELVRDEFEDVVILREVHRIDKELKGVDAQVAADYADEAERWLKVTADMAECKWTAKDHAWLSKRNRERLLRSEEGREQVQECSTGLLLMDGVRKNAREKTGLSS